MESNSKGRQPRWKVALADPSTWTPEGRHLAASYLVGLELELLECVAKASGREELLRSTPLCSRRQRLAEGLISQLTPRELDQALDHARDELTSGKDQIWEEEAWHRLRAWPAWAQEVAEDSKWNAQTLELAKSDLLKRDQQEDKHWGTADHKLIRYAISLSGRAEGLRTLLDSPGALSEVVGAWLSTMTPAEVVKVVAQARETLADDYLKHIREKFWLETVDRVQPKIAELAREWFGSAVLPGPTVTITIDFEPGPGFGPNRLISIDIQGT